MSTVVSELLALVTVRVREEDTPAAFAKRLAYAANDLTDDVWETLPDRVQHWVNDAVEAIRQRQEIPLPSGIEGVFREESVEEDPVKPPRASRGAKSKVPVAQKKAPVAVKAVAAKKKAKASAKAVETSVGRRGKFSPDSIIRVVSAENPFRPSSKGAGWFAKYASGMQVAQALDAGVPRSQIRWDLRHGHIVVE